MPPKTLTQGEKKKIKQENKAKANPGKAAAKKEKADAKRTRRWVMSYTSQMYAFHVQCCIVLYEYNTPRKVEEALGEMSEVVHVKDIIGSNECRSTVITAWNQCNTCHRFCFSSLMININSLLYVYRKESGSVKKMG